MTALQFLQQISQNFLLLYLLFISVNLTAQSWEQLNDPPFYKHHSNGFGFNGKAYVLEGINGTDGPNDVSSEVWEYTAATDSWQQLADFPGPARAIAIGDEWNGKYYYGFGSAGPGGVLNDLWEFDPTTQTFTELPSCPCIGRSHPAFIAHNDKIMMGAGSTFDGDLNDWWEYDMITQVWTQKQDIPGGDRHHPFFFGIDNEVYVGGGHRNNWIRYNLDTEQWTEIDDTPAGRVAGSQIDYKNKGYLIGGDDVNHVHVPDNQTFMSYNADAEEWEFLPPLPNGSRWACSTFIIDDVLYYFGGLSSEIQDDVTMWKFDLTLLDCLPPQNLIENNVTETTADLFWTSNPNTNSDTLKWRQVGTAAWNDIPNPQAVLSLTGLEACQAYEWKLILECDAQSSYSNTKNFITDGCCSNPPIAIDDITGNTSIISWTNITAADTYDVRWKAIDDMTWSTATITINNIELTDLNNCTEYEFQIKSVCTIANIEYSESQYFLTKDCGACIDLDYCDVPDFLEGTSEFINEVKINNYVNTSGDNGGYANFAIPDAESILLGETFELYLEPGFGDSGFSNDFRVWIDFDGNGNFENNEVVLNEEGIDNAITRNISVPMTASPGLTRMRILYAYFESSSPCEQGQVTWGEAEDYCVNIVMPTNISAENEDLNDLTVYPNPFDETIAFVGNLDSSKKYGVELLSVTGKSVHTISDFSLTDQIDLSALPTGIYLLKIGNASGNKTFKIVKRV